MKPTEREKVQILINEKAAKLAAQRKTSILYLNTKMGQGSCCAIPQVLIQVLEKPKENVLYKTLDPDLSPDGIEIHYESGMDLYEFNAPIEISAWGIGNVKRFFVPQEINIFANDFHK